MLGFSLASVGSFCRYLKIIAVKFEGDWSMRRYRNLSRNKLFPFLEGTQYSFKFTVISDDEYRLCLKVFDFHKTATNNSGATHLHTHVRVHVCMPACACLCVCICVCVKICVYVHECERPCLSVVL